MLEKYIENIFILLHYDFRDYLTIKYNFNKIRFIRIIKRLDYYFNSNST